MSKSITYSHYLFLLAHVHIGSTESRPAIPVKNKRPKSPVVADQPSKRRREETTDHDHRDGNVSL